MFCYSIDDLVGYIENSISTEKKEEIRKHLKSCGVCKEKYIALKITDKYMTNEVTKEKADNKRFYFDLCKHIDVNKYSNNSKYSILFSLKKTVAKSRVVTYSAISSVLLVALILTGTMFLSNFSEKTSSPDSETKIQDEQQRNNDESKDNIVLPEGYSIDKIKSALMEYINMRLWLYPDIGYNSSDKNFDNYINEIVDFEIILVNKSVYASTNVGESLLIFTDRDGFIYVDGQVNPDEDYWPDMSDYIVIDKFSIQIPEPQKPDYGK